jgi:hypothetical protein
MRVGVDVLAGSCSVALVLSVMLLSRLGCCGDAPGPAAEALFFAPYPALLLPVLYIGWSVASRAGPAGAAIFAVTTAVHYAALPFVLLMPGSPDHLALPGDGRDDSWFWFVAMPVHALVHLWLWGRCLLEMSRGRAARYRADGAAQVHAHHAATSRTR